MPSLCSSGDPPRQNLRFILFVWLGVRIQQTFGQEARTDVYKARVGEAVTMDAPPTAVLVTVSWYRGTEKTSRNLLFRYFARFSTRNKGPQYTGRETLLADGSLHIRDVRLSDTGDYGVVLEGVGAKTAGSRRLEVHEDPPTPPIPTSSACSCSSCSSCSSWKLALGVACAVLLTAAAVLVAGVVVHYERRLNRKGTQQGGTSYVNSNMLQSPETQYENRREGNVGYSATQVTQATGADSAYLDLSHEDQAAYEKINRL